MKLPSLVSAQISETINYFYITKKHLLRAVFCYNALSCNCRKKKTILTPEIKMFICF